MAWSVPLAVGASSVPAYAASICTEVRIPTFSDTEWTWENNAPIDHVRRELGTKFQGIGRYMRFFSRDNVHRNRPTTTANLHTVVHLTAGCTYSIAVPAKKIQNNGENQPDHTDQWIDIYLGGTKIAGATTGAATSDRIPLSSTVDTDIVGQYTATTTGPTPLRYEFTLLRPVAPHFGNDDIVVGPPTFSI